MGSSPTRAIDFKRGHMYYITYNDVVTPHPYHTRQEAVAELKKTFGDLGFDALNIVYWPSVSARGHTKIEIKRIENELE